MALKNLIITVLSVLSCVAIAYASPTPTHAAEVSQVALPAIESDISLPESDIQLIVGELLQLKEDNDALKMRVDAIENPFGYTREEPAREQVGKLMRHDPKLGQKKFYDGTYQGY